MNFYTFFAVKLKYTKIYYNGYNILVGYDVYTISDIIWNGRNGRWAQLKNVLRKESIDSNY